MEKTYLIMFNSKAWHAHEDILVDDYLIKCHKAIDYGADGGYRGARYKVAFSRRFPHFEVRLIPVTLVFNSQINLCNPGRHVKGAVSRQSCPFCLVLPITGPYLLWKLTLAKKLLVNEKSLLRDKQIRLSGIIFKVTNNRDEL